MSHVFAYPSRPESRLDRSFDLRRYTVLHRLIQEPVPRAIITVVVSAIFAMLVRRPMPVPLMMVPIAAFVMLFLATGYKETDEKQRGY
jgi:hypothetical protein